MIQVNSILQDKKTAEDEFGFGSFAWVPVGKDEIELMLSRVVKSDTVIDMIVVSDVHKYNTGLGRARNKWSKAQGGSRNIFYDPSRRDTSISLAAGSVLAIASQVSGKVNPSLFVESELLHQAKSELGLIAESNLNKMKIICY